ncbi:MAG: hypothetical protein M3O89_06830, partial [Actinomycetota bacterium]|nr:hypothetical protein [Actinomycetota bacterium]
FLAVPLATAYRARPGATLGLTIGAALFMAGATLTGPLEAWDGHVVHRVVTGTYVDSAASFLGLGGKGADVLFLVALGLAAAAAIGGTPWRAVLRREVLAGTVALAGWLVLTAKIHGLLGRGKAGEAAVLAAAAVTAVLVALAYRTSPSLRPPSSVQSTGAEH